MEFLTDPMFWALVASAVGNIIQYFIKGGK